MQIFSGSAVSFLPLSPCLISIKHSTGPIESNFKTRDHVEKKEQMTLTFFPSSSSCFLQELNDTVTSTAGRSFLKHAVSSSQIEWLLVVPVISGKADMLYFIP